MNKISIKYGIIAGFAVIGYMLLFYLIDKTVMLGWKVYWSSFIFYLFGMYMACSTFRESNEDVLGIQEGTRAAFITFLVANAILYIFNYILFNFVDPELIHIQAKAGEEMYTEIMGKEEAKKMIEAMNEGGFEMTIGTAIKGYASGAIGGFVLSLLIAAALRREY